MGGTQCGEGDEEITIMEGIIVSGLAIHLKVLFIITPAQN